MAHQTQQFTQIELGEIEQARSRHMWTRSSVHVTEDLVVAGQWDGTVTAVDADTLETRFTVTHPEHAVGLASVGEQVIVAGRGADGTIASYDGETGERRWRYDTTVDVGSASKDSIFYLPYVTDVQTAGDTVYAVARRYERDGEDRVWHSTVYAFDLDGSVRWRYSVDASPISLDLDGSGERLAVGYNRCMGDHDTGLVVLETGTGEPAWTWDPGTPGDRRVGDVSFDGDQIAVSSHGDKRGYVLGPGGTEQWRVDLAVETDVGEETLYAYPNHTYRTAGYTAFVTGNTYATESRETENRHPHEHRIATFDDTGNLVWDADVRGFVHGLATDGETVVAPCAQNFRVRDPNTHGIRWYDIGRGDEGSLSFDGIGTAAGVSNGTIGAIEEPVEYHDEGTVRGTYALHVGSIQ